MDGRLTSACDADSNLERVEVVCQAFYGMRAGALCCKTPLHIAHHDWSNTSCLLFHRNKASAKQDLDEIFVTFPVE